MLLSSVREVLCETEGHLTVQDVRLGPMQDAGECHQLLPSWLLLHCFVCGIPGHRHRKNLSCTRRWRCSHLLKGITGAACAKMPRHGKLAPPGNTECQQTTQDGLSWRGVHVGGAHDPVLEVQVGAAIAGDQCVNGGAFVWNAWGSQKACRALQCCGSLFGHARLPCGMMCTP
jgi:hypothetical protein